MISLVFLIIKELQTLHCLTLCIVTSLNRHTFQYKWSDLLRNTNFTIYKSYVPATSYEFLNLTLSLLVKFLHDGA